MKKNVRVRFAPSPTGPLHIGGVRTALYNYLFAKKHGGKFILRIEDTDRNRFVEGAKEYIEESLEWCGIKIDESTNAGGNFGPYIQSERKDIYKKYINELIESGNAYYAFDTSDELDTLRKQYELEKKVFVYNSETRKRLKNSLTLSKEEVNTKLTNENFVVRFKIPENEQLIMNDVIRGEILINTNTLDDKILFKSDGMPTYHLANIIDDHLMEISHVIRGEEWLPSMPLHVLLYKAFGWGNNMPEFAHLPLLLKPTGNGKLSKRDGDKLGFPVFPLFWNAPNGDTASGYKENGYFPDAFINFLSLLGWNSGTEQEIFSMEELIQAFSLEKVNKSGARFDHDKAKWFNNQYLQKKSDLELANLFSEELKEKGISSNIGYITEIVSLIKERAGFVNELWSQSFFFFEKPTEYDKKIIKKRWKEGIGEKLKNIVLIIDNLSNFSRDNIHDSVIKYIEDNELNMGQIMNSMRVSLVGSASGPDLFRIIELLGKQETIDRINIAIEKVNK